MRVWTGFDGRPLFSYTGWGGVDLGLRVSRFAQIDLGVEFTGPVIGPHRDAYDERLMRNVFGTWVPRDPSQPLEDPVSDGFLAMFPFGARFILPVAAEHILIGLGGGGAVVMHSEANDRDLTIPDGKTIRGCAASCETRYGLGEYGLARLEFHRSAGRIGVGVVSRYTRARLNGGKYLPRFAGSGDHDEWLQVGATMSLRF